MLSLIDGRRGVPVQIGVNLYQALVRPHMEYAIPVWASISDRDISKLEVEQCQSLKEYLEQKYTHLQL